MPSALAFMTTAPHEYFPPCRISFGKGAFCLEEFYLVYLGKEAAGKVQVLREGLYYRFVCRCSLTGDVVCRLVVRCGETQENLGVVVPLEQGFGLDKRIPAKRLGEGKMSFFLMPKHDAVSGRFVPIYPEEPFAYIARLKDAFLARQNGQVGIVMRP